jgi:DNA-binding response OmpR family regulator
MARKKILLVDDSATILMMEKMILAKEPYDLVTAKDGQEAVAKALSERPDAILLDVVMPRMTGFQACQAIRAQEGTRDIPIIMVTTRGEAENVESGFEHGCNDYVTKPIDSVELLAKLRSLIGEQGRGE